MAQDDPRTVIAVSGPDRTPFLQGLVTNDVRHLTDGPRYAALLTPQGKILADFLLVAADPGLVADTILIDVAAPLAADLLRRLTMYRLRADVQVRVTDLAVTRGTGPAPAGAIPDPRHPALGWRLYGPHAGDDGTDWDALRVAHVIPQTGIEIVPGDSYPLEMGFERLHGVDFRKGCYVGQEVTARMKHKTDLRKGVVAVQVAGPALPGTPIVTPDGREAGVLHTRSGDRALAYLRLDRAPSGLVAGDAVISLPGAAPAG
ncbi:MAG: folate-binding protein [Rhodobacteraceae bacterium]|jgi:hypothetical protein|nr:folate-binding protein [Paracoccaceae bacterium]